jgi:pimeloyl-ACP methyl ester carboxylesterase
MRPGSMAPPGIVLFVHGFGSSSQSWKPLLDLLHGDERIASRYEFVCWDYPTRALGRIPPLQEVCRILAAELDAPRYCERPITFVGHSQGGLVIQYYFADVLNRGEGSRLGNVRQAIFLATPSEGSTTASSLRYVLSTIIDNPQEETLRVLNPEVAAVRAVVRERVVAATEDTDRSWRVPIHAFCGLEDTIVPEASARGVLDNFQKIPGTHFSIIQPPTRDDPRYARLAELLLEPGGHSHRFDIAGFECDVRVEPRPQEVIRTTNDNPRDVVYDNYGVVTRSVKFSPANRCRDKFRLRYATRKEGYVMGHPSGPNQAEPSELGLWEDYGTSFEFAFSPEAGVDAYSLKVEVYRGFDAGSRDLHFHLRNDSYYGRLVYRLDLTAYETAGWAVSMGPHFYLEPKDVTHGELCRHRADRNPIPASRTPEGIYYWELSDLEEGVVDIVWDMSVAATAV